MEITQSLQERAFNERTQVELYRDTINVSYLELAKHLKEVKESKLYKYMGDDGQNTWESFCAGVKIHSKKADMYIKIYNYYIEKLQIPSSEVLEVSIDNLNRLKSPMEKLPNDQERLEMFDKMKTLTYSDLNKELVEKNVIQERKINICRCKTCQKLEIYYRQEEICMCKGTTAIYTFPVELGKQKI